MAVFSRYLTTLEVAVNAFYNHHQDNIRFSYRCFDRILLNGLIQPFQQPERVVGFFDTYRHLYPVSRDVLRGAAEQFQVWVKEQAAEWNAPIVEFRHRDIIKTSNCPRAPDVLRSIETYARDAAALG